MDKQEATVNRALYTFSLTHHSKPALIIPEDGERIEQTVTYGALRADVEALASRFAARGLQGQALLLIFQDVQAFLTAFLACQRIGAIPVPVPYARGEKQLARLAAIAMDVEASAILCKADTLQQLHRHSVIIDPLGRMKIIATDERQDVSPVFAEEDVSQPIAFIQYTSGSTGVPKGVVVTMQALAGNLESIRDCFDCREDSVILSWLPFHHDMGLIGNLLEALFVGATAVVMSPLNFIQRPARWLEAISKYRATHSGGPNFSYDLCMEKIGAAEVSRLDLSSWRVAYNGSEPVRAETMENFAGYFGSAGFSITRFFPCYGLAEATLLVTGVKADAEPSTYYVDKRAVAGCGRVIPGLDLKIVGPKDGRQCDELEEGEICLSGPSVMRGYWGSVDTDCFLNMGEATYLRTGDLGFLHRGELFVTGRIKEMLILRGRNIYPYDIEVQIAEAHPEIEPHGVVLFALQGQDEGIVIVAEVRRSSIRGFDAHELIMSLDRVVYGALGIPATDIVLIPPLGIARTTSGKLQRLKSREDFLQGRFRMLASKTGLRELSSDVHAIPTAGFSTGDESVRAYLIRLIESRVGPLRTRTSLYELELTALGIDSIRAMELVNAINRDWNINLDAAKVFEDNTLSALIETVENMIWLKSDRLTGKEIII